MSIIHEALRKAEVEKERVQSPVLETFSIDHVLDLASRMPKREPSPAPRNSLKYALGLGSLFVVILLSYLAVSFVYQAYMRRMAFQEEAITGIKPLRQLYHEKLANPEIQKPVIAEAILEKPKPMRQLYHERLMNTQPAMRNENMFQVMGIVSEGENRSALINGQLVGVGDSVDGASVKAVEDNQVILEKGGRQFSISLH
ncbi:MAG TPA: hypothetical protein PKL97_04485 [Candidatus Omnitrophota bacterium]|nr:hypothetical protein [Candidatus Omnitrophota bacterium]